MYVYTLKELLYFLKTKGCSAPTIEGLLYSNRKLVLQIADIVIFDHTRNVFVQIGFIAAYTKKAITHRLHHASAKKRTPNNLWVRLLIEQQTK